MNANQSPGRSLSPPVCRTGLLAASLLAALLACGCSPWRLSDGLPWKGRDDKPRVPDRIVDIWVDDVLHRSGEPSTRGFGGRIVFYHRDAKDPVKVDGTLTAYVFDDRCEDPLREPPTHKFVFPADTMEKHYSQSEVGHSYSFWVPIDKVGGPERRLTLIVRFEPRLGGRILSKPSTHILPGIPSEEPASPLLQRYSKRLNGEIRPADQETPPGQTAPPQTANPGVTSATIQLSPTLARQIRAAPPSQSLPPAAQAVAVIPPGVAAGAGLPASPVQQASYLAPTAPAPSPTAPATSPAGPATRGQPSRFPVQRDALGRPITTRIRRQPLGATWPSALPSTPRSAPAVESPAAPSPSLSALPADWEE
ncbi:MAG: hypothetical protein GXY25_02005 [Pirellulaceae bacterium]|jgi:hypothetical protein|nr:hypothetical protein [Thermoguttaceae bacterium]MDI9444479.1 hypothetical protein [Planctomycetota bacterium]NLY99291.1 hypothetical protein [Pirellulaceae bacterium]